MYIEEHTHPVPGGLSIKGLSRSDLYALYRALAYTPISPGDRLYELRDTIFRFLADNQ